MRPAISIAQCINTIQTQFWPLLCVEVLVVLLSFTSLCGVCASTKAVTRTSSTNEAWK